VAGIFKIAVVFCTGIVYFRPMLFRARLAAVIWGMTLGINFFHTQVLADDDAAPGGTQSVTAKDSANAFFGWLDARSAYDNDFFPQPLLVDDTSLQKEPELEFSSLRMQANARHSDIVAAEVQNSFGLLTMSLNIPYERDSAAGHISQGIDNINIGGRYPLYQRIAANGFFDTTFGVGLEIGIPASSVISVNAELNPKIFNDLKLGKHFSIQSVLGYSALLGGGDNGGLDTFQYGFAFAYAIGHSEMPLPGVQQLTPLLELVGNTGLSKTLAGQNNLLGSLGFRLDLKPIGDVQPSLGLGYVFPVDNGAHADFHWGIVTSLIFDF